MLLSGSRLFCQAVILGFLFTWAEWAVFSAGEVRFSLGFMPHFTLERWLLFVRSLCECKSLYRDILKSFVAVFIVQGEILIASNLFFVVNGRWFIRSFFDLHITTSLLERVLLRLKCSIYWVWWWQLNVDHLTWHHTSAVIWWCSSFSIRLCPIITVSQLYLL